MSNNNNNNSSKKTVTAKKVDNAPEAPPSNAPAKTDPPAANIPKAHASNSTDTVVKTNVSDKQVEDASINPNNNNNVASRTVVTHANDGIEEVVKPSPNKSFPLNSPPGATGSTTTAGGANNTAAVPVPLTRDPYPTKEAIEQGKKIEEDLNKKSEQAVKKKDHSNNKHTTSETKTQKKKTK